MVLAAVVAIIINRREAQISYHNKCLRLGGRYLQVMNNVSAFGNPPPRAGFIEDCLLRLCYKDDEDVGQSINKHTQALLDAGYFVREEFSMENRPLDDPTNRTAFFQAARIRFKPGSDADWWTISSSLSNSIVVTTTKPQMPSWRKLVEEFDRP